MPQHLPRPIHRPPQLIQILQRPDDPPRNSQSPPDPSSNTFTDPSDSPTQHQPHRPWRLSPGLQRKIIASRRIRGIILHRLGKSDPASPGEVEAESGYRGTGSVFPGSEDNSVGAVAASLRPHPPSKRDRPDRVSPPRCTSPVDCPTSKSSAKNRNQLLRRPSLLPTPHS